eukprot:PhM_4_TR2737/c0_g1_i1/m.45977
MVEFHPGSAAEAIASFRGYTPSVPQEHFSPLASLKKSTLLAPVKFPSCTVSDVFAVLWKSDAFIVEYHERRDDKNMKVSDWSCGPGGDFGGARSFVCTTQVKTLTTISTTLYESQRYTLSSSLDATNPNKTLMVHLSSQTPDVTMGSNFRVEVLVEFVEDGAGNVVMQLYRHINFLRSVAFFQSKIENTAAAELGKGFVVFIDLAMRLVESNKGGVAAGAPAVVKEGAAKKKKKRVTAAPAPMAVPTYVPPPAPDNPSMNPVAVVAAVVGGLLVLLLIMLLWSTVSSIATATDRLNAHRAENRHDATDILLGLQQPLDEDRRHHHHPAQKQQHRGRQRVVIPTRRQEPGNADELNNNNNNGTTAVSSLDPAAVWGLVQEMNDVRRGIEHLSAQVATQAWTMWFLAFGCCAWLSLVILLQS